MQLIQTNRIDFYQSKLYILQPHVFEAIQLQVLAYGFINYDVYIIKKNRNKFIRNTGMVK